MAEPQIPQVNEFARADLDGIWRVIVEPNTQFDHALREFYSYHLKCFAAGRTPEWHMFQSLARTIRRQAKDRQTFETCARMCLALAQQNAIRRFTFWPVLRPAAFDSIQPELLRDLRAQLRQTRHPVGKTLRRVYRYFVQRFEVGDLEPDDAFNDLRAELNALYSNDSEGDETIRLLYAVAEDDVRRRPSYERFVNIGLVVLALLVGFMLPILLGRPLLTWVVPAAIASAVVLIGLWQGAQRVIPLRKNVYDYLIRFAGMAGLTAGVLVLLSRLHR